MGKWIAGMLGAAVLVIGMASAPAEVASADGAAAMRRTAATSARTGDEAACRQWCSREVCNDKGECRVIYWCCG